LIGGVGTQYSCWTATHVSDSYSITNVSGVWDVGGLVGGGDYDYYDNFACTVIDLHNTYSAGNVQGDFNVGGLVGSLADGRYQIWGDENYWDIDSSGQEESANGIGKTTLQMLQEDTFTDWDFDEVDGIWAIVDFNPYIRKHYPILQWQLDNQDDEWYEKNMIENAHVKIYDKNRNWHWEGFPRLEEQADFQDSLAYTIEIMEPLEGIIEQVLGWSEGEDGQLQTMEWDDPNWTFDDIAFNSKYGYKLQIPDDTEDYYLYASGNRIASNTEVTLYPGRENWIGYYLPESQELTDSFTPYMNDLMVIEGEEGGVYCYQDPKTGQSTWFTGTTLYTYYGKMYNVQLKPNATAFDFSWSSPTRGDLRPQYYPVKPRPQYFSFHDKPNYESFFIEEIDNDEGIEEIAVFAGDVCVGATVFEGLYPVEIQAYTDQSHIGKGISFVIHRGTRNGEEERFRVVEARNLASGEYERKVLQPHQNKFTLLRLEEGDYTETVIAPQVVMGQNFPNPFEISANNSLGSQTRSESVVATNIPIYLSQDMNVDISVYNVKGQRVKTLTTGNLAAGKHNISWNGRNEQNQPVSAGIYFYKLESEIETINKKMLLIR